MDVDWIWGAGLVFDRRGVFLGRVRVTGGTDSVKGFVGVSNVVVELELEVSAWGGFEGTGGVERDRGREDDGVVLVSVMNGAALRIRSRSP